MSGMAVVDVGVARVVRRASELHVHASLDDEETDSSPASACPFARPSSVACSCQHSTRAAEEDLTADAKLSALWKELEKGALPAPESFAPAWPSAGAVYSAIFGKTSTYGDLLTTRDDTKAEAKTLCAVGAVALAEMVWNGAGARRGWSGLFGGASTGVGLLRLSSAARPPNVSGGGRAAGFLLGSLRDANVFPCVGFKLPRTGTPSASLLFLGRKTGQSDPSFFGSCVASCATEKCSALVGKVLDVFRAYSKYPCHVGLSDAARSDRDGRTADAISFPWALVLKPTADARSSRPAAAGPACTYFLRQLDTLPAGTALYDVFAVATPHGALAETAASADGLVRLGQLVSRSRFVRSGEERHVHFWHQRKEEDYALRPDWEQAHGTHQRLACGGEFFGGLIDRGLCAVE